MKPGDIGAIVVGERIVPCTVIEVLPGGLDFRVRITDSVSNAAEGQRTTPRTSRASGQKAGSPRGDTRPGGGPGDQPPRFHDAAALAAREDRIEADHG